MTAGCIHPNPSQPSESIYNYAGEVEFVVDAPQIKEKIEQDLTANPPFGGSKKYQIVFRKYSTLPSSYELGVQNIKDETVVDNYHLVVAGEVEAKENYRLFSFESGILGLYKWDVVPFATEDGKPIATYDVFVKRISPASLEGSKWYFCEDLTEKYRQIFPNEDIHAVVRRLVLSYVNGGNVIRD